MLKFFQLGLFTVVMSISVVANAHGPQMQITNDNGKIVTRQIVLNPATHPGQNYGALTNATSVFVMPVLPFQGQWFARPNTDPYPLNSTDFYSGPGLTFGANLSPGGSGFIFDTGSRFNVNLLDSLLVWNGSSFVDPGSEQVQLFRGSSLSPNLPTATATTSDVTPFSTLAYGNVTAPVSGVPYGGEGAEVHVTGRIRFLGDGSDPLFTPDDGLYLLKLSVSTTQSGIATSDPFYYLLNKNADSALSAAVSSLGYGLGDTSVQVIPVPEPSTWLAMSVLALGALYWKRKRILDRKFLPNWS